MKSRIYDENLMIIFSQVKKMLGQLDYEYSFRTEISMGKIFFEALKDNMTTTIILHQKRKGIVKVSVETESKIKSIKDYEQKRKLELSLLKTLDRFLQPVTDEHLYI